MACAGAYATPEEFREYWFFAFDPTDDPELQPILDKSAARIHAALAASGQCDCTQAPWAIEYLKELNIIIAGVYFNVACVRISEDQRKLYNEYIVEQLGLIRNGEIETCQRETAKQTPSFAIAQYALTDRQAATLVAKR